MTQARIGRSYLHICVRVCTFQTDSFKVDQELAQHEDSLKHLLHLSQSDRLSRDPAVKSGVEAEPVQVLLAEQGGDRAKAEDSVHSFLASASRPGTSLDNPTR